MSSTLHTPSFGPVPSLEPLRAKWGWIVALGIVYLVAGLIALSSVVTATVASVFVVGIMMLVGGGLRVALATTHLPLSEVPRAITRQGLRRTLEALDRELKLRFRLPRPRILIMPMISSLYAVPLVILYPVFTVWLGIGSESKIAFAAIYGFLPTMLSTAAGIQKQGRAGLPATRGGCQLRARAHQVGVDRIAGVAAHWHQALLAALHLGPVLQHSRYSMESDRASGHASVECGG